MRVVNVGLDAFTQVLDDLAVPYQNVAWKPPAQGDSDLTELLFRLAVDCRDDDGQSPIDRANQTALDRVLSAQPILRTIQPARDCLPVLDSHTLLHAGPPLAPDDMPGPMRGACVGALLYERLAASHEDAEALLQSGRVRLQPTCAYNVVAPMAGVVSPSMQLFVVENAAFGNRAYSPLNEGVGQVLRFGANTPPVIDHLRWLNGTVAPVLAATVERLGGVPLKSIIARALLMGDELHQRNAAAGLAFHQAIGGELVAARCDTDELGAIVSFLTRFNEQFFLNLAMAAAKSALDPAHGVPGCSMVTAMSRNGVDFGIRVSGLGDQWITAPSLYPRGLYFPGYSEDDANPDLGDSAIVECYGLGGMALAASPMVAKFLGAGSIVDALASSVDMNHITIGANSDFPLPGLDFSGVPTGIDLLRVVATGILPRITSGVAHRDPGVGQVGAGVTTPPMDAMNKALRLFAAAMLGPKGTG